MPILAFPHTLHPGPNADSDSSLFPAYGFMSPPCVPIVPWLTPLPHKNLFMPLYYLQSDKALQQMEHPSHGSRDLPPSLLHCSPGDCYGKRHHTHHLDFHHDGLIFSVTSSPAHEGKKKHQIYPKPFLTLVLSIRLGQMRHLPLSVWWVNYCQPEAAP